MSKASWSTNLRETSCHRHASITEERCTRTYAPMSATREVPRVAGRLAESPELPISWLAVMACFDLVFFTAAWLFGGYLLEE